MAAAKKVISVKDHIESGRHAVDSCVVVDGPTPSRVLKDITEKVKKEETGVESSMGDIVTKAAIAEMKYGTKCYFCDRIRIDREKDLNDIFKGLVCQSFICQRNESEKCPKDVSKETLM